jgi:hypothetical protein
MGKEVRCVRRKRTYVHKTLTVVTCCVQIALSMRGRVWSAVLLPADHLTGLTRGIQKRLAAYSEENFRILLDDSDATRERQTSVPGRDAFGSAVPGRATAWSDAACIVSCTIHESVVLLRAFSPEHFEPLIFTHVH